MNVNVTVAAQAADGLDLKAVTALLKEVKSAEDLEEKINSGTPRLSNLDLNEDGTIDYVKVEEYSAGEVKGFSLTTELGPDDVQELATIEIMKDGEKGYVAQTHGNSQIYGNHYYHRSSFGLGDFLLWNYLLSSHRPYHSPYGYQRYPTSYRASQPLASADYRSKMSKVDSAGVRASRRPTFKGSGASPNKARTSSKIKAPLKNPTFTQRAFQARNPSKSVRSGGFGSSSSGSSSGSFRSSSRSGSSFGGGK